jgi:hypothetical protein
MDHDKPPCSMVHKNLSDAPCSPISRRNFPSSCVLTDYLLQQPLLQDVFAIETASVALSAQQAAEQPFDPSSQQSHLHSSQVHTPVSQQQWPSEQQLSQAQTFASPGGDVLAKFAPIAIPSPITHINTSVAASFIFSFLR